MEEQSVEYIDALKKLSPREIEILELVGKGYTSREISKRLYISIRTTEKHRENISSKLDLNGYNCIQKWYRDRK